MVRERLCGKRTFGQGCKGSKQVRQVDVRAGLFQAKERQAPGSVLPAESCVVNEAQSRSMLLELSVYGSGRHETRWPKMRTYS